MSLMTNPTAISEVRQEVKNLLRAGAILLPAMDPEPEPQAKFSRVCAAQLVDLAMRRHLWFSYGHTHVGAKGLLATRHPDPLDDPDADEQRLLDVVFGGAQVARIAEPRPWARWSEMAAMVRKGLKADGLGMLRIERYRVLRALRALREDMRVIARSGERDWNSAPDVFRAGCSFAVLFSLDTRVPHWPMPPEEEGFVPSLLSLACHQAHLDAT